ncbi:MAG TPA: MmcQ/YjbR family DNA-binding protein [Segeticoccus sp.]|jgi:hypothetical protein|nr:MmcQ/YjbR family DNA-binding protein [Segeticoccus sp.]
MAHPTRYDDHDPWLQRLREIALAFPEAAEKVSHGRPVFFTQKVFVMYGASVKGDHASRRWDRSVVVKPDEEERRALLEDARFFEPAYVGPSGWIGLDLRAAETDWDEVRELVDASYRNTAPRRLVAGLGAAAP